MRARAVKSELSDVEGLGFKLEERQKDILELKRTLKMKVRCGTQLYTIRSVEYKHNRSIIVPLTEVEKMLTINTLLYLKSRDIMMFCIDQVMTFFFHPAPS